MKNNEIVEIDGKKFRVELHEAKVPTYEEALKVVKPIFYAQLTGSNVIPYIAQLKGNVPTEKDALSLLAYQKLKVLEAYYNEGEEGDFGIFLTQIEFAIASSREVFNLKDIETAHRFIEEQKELLKQFYQI